MHAGRLGSEWVALCLCRWPANASVARRQANGRNFAAASSLSSRPRPSLAWLPRPAQPARMQRSRRQPRACADLWEAKRPSLWRAAKSRWFQSVAQWVRCCGRPACLPPRWRRHAWQARARSGKWRGKSAGKIEANVSLRSNVRPARERRFRCGLGCQWARRGPAVLSAVATCQCLLDFRWLSLDCGCGSTQNAA